MAKCLSAEKTLAQIREVAERIKNNETASVGTVSLGDCVRQGDIYLVAISDLPKSSKTTLDRQLAPGSTQGSRHVLSGDCQVFTAEAAEVSDMIRLALAPTKVEVPTDLIGPVFRTLSEVTVTHPEHGHRILPAGECFATVYERQFSEEVRRVFD